MNDYNFKSVKSEIIVHSTDELLLMQSKGKFLTPLEKQRVLKYASEKRKQNQKIKK